MLKFDFAIKKVHVLSVAALVVCVFFAVAVIWYMNMQHELQETGSDAAATLIDSEATPYTNLDGSPFRFSDVRGKVRVVNIWASWSPYSRDELAYLQTVAEQYDSADLAVIAINRKEPIHRIEAFLRQFDEDMSDLHIVVDETDAFYKNVAGYAMPETLVYDSEGTLQEHIRGPVDEDVFEQILDNWLE